MDIKYMTLDEFTKKTAEKASVPGAGSVAALAGAIGASLAGFVASLTIDKPGYQHFRDEMCAILQKSEMLRVKLLDDIQRDCTAFNAYITALSLPEDNNGQQTERHIILQQALKDAILVPLEIAQTALSIMPLAKLAAEHGNDNAITDGIISAIMVRTSAMTALCSVKINLKLIEDPHYVLQTTDLVNGLERQVLAMEAEILSKAPF